MDIFLSYEPISVDTGFSSKNNLKTTIIYSPQNVQNGEESIYPKNKYFSEFKHNKKTNKIFLTDFSNSNKVLDKILLNKSDNSYNHIIKDRNFIVDATNEKNLQTENIIDSGNKNMNVYYFNSVISKIEKNVQLNLGLKHKVFNLFEKENKSDHLSNSQNKDFSHSFVYQDVNENSYSNSNLLLMKDNEFIVKNTNKVKNIFNINNDLIQDYSDLFSNNNTINLLVNNYELLPQNNYKETEYFDYINNLNNKYNYSNSNKKKFLEERIARNFSIEYEIENICKDRLYTNIIQNSFPKKKENNLFDISLEENIKKEYSNKSNIDITNNLIQSSQNQNDLDNICFSRNTIKNNYNNLENKNEIKLEEFNNFLQPSIVEPTILINNYQTLSLKGQILDLIHELPFSDYLIETNNPNHFDSVNNFVFHNNRDNNDISIQPILLEKELKKNILQSNINMNNFFNDNREKSFFNFDNTNTHNEGIIIENESSLEYDIKEKRYHFSETNFDVNFLDKNLEILTNNILNNQDIEPILEENSKTKLNMYKPNIRYHLEIENDFNETRFLYEKDMNSWMRKKCNYMENQLNVKPRMRKILLDWINEVSSQLNFKRSTFHLSIALMDTFLSNYNNLDVDKLQLTGVTCLIIAAKYEVLNLKNKAFLWNSSLFI